MENNCNTKFYVENVVSTGYASTFSGNIVTATASASATSYISYDDAYNIASHIALQNATLEAQNSANLIKQTLGINQQPMANTSQTTAGETTCSIVNESPYYVENVYVTGYSKTSNGGIVTATASASASSTISYEDAYFTAYNIALQNATLEAQNSANIITQAEETTAELTAIAVAGAISAQKSAAEAKAYATVAKKYAEICASLVDEIANSLQLYNIIAAELNVILVKNSLTKRELLDKFLTFIQTENS